MKDRLLLLILAISVLPLLKAWGPTGHRVVGEIAQHHLTPAARRRVAAILHGYTLAEVANWPDELRSAPRFDKYKRLHFATVPDGMAGYRESKKDSCGDLVAAINAISAYLETGSRQDLFAVPALTDKPDGAGKGACNPEETEPITEDTALRFLVHFIGDLHQPLHIGGMDLGGNAIKVDWMKRWQTNLHSVWDDDMPDFERLDYLEFARFLDHASEAEIARWQAGDTVSWADESVAIRPQLYQFPDGPKLVSYGYIGAQRDRMRQQLLKGGLRLAGVLNKAFR